LKGKFNFKIMEMKLTLVSLTCRNCMVETFIKLRADAEGKAFISKKQIDELFLKNHDFTPDNNETVGITPKSVGFSK